MSNVTAAPPALLTAEEFVARHENDRAELVEGIVVEVPMPGYEHGLICNTIACDLTIHVRKRKLGTVVSCDTFVQTKRGPDSVRGMDVGFFSYKRQAKGKRPKGIPPVSPDLVVEVRSPSDRLRALNSKALEYLAAGVRAVVVVDPKLAAVTVFRDEELPQTFHNGDTLTVPDVLPGFAVPLATLFD